MKKFVLFQLAFILCLGSFAQSSYQPKVVVLFMGEKNPTFDEAKFPDCTFYYTPGITAREEKTQSLLGKGLQKASGIKGVQETTFRGTFSGSPAEAYSENLMGAYLFDKNGYVTATYKGYKEVCTSPKKNLQGTYSFVTYDKISKDYIKKGEETKKAKKSPKKPKHLFDYHGMEMPYDFEVVNASGEKKMIKDLVKGEPLTLFYCLYLSPDVDLKSAMESGKGKKGKDYINETISASQGIKRLSMITSIEDDIFGHKVAW